MVVAKSDLMMYMMGIDAQGDACYQGYGLNSFVISYLLSEILVHTSYLDGPAYHTHMTGECCLNFV